jgi:hypothetical protein
MWAAPMTDQQRDQLETELRDALSHCIQLLRPFAMSHGRFVDINDVGVSVSLAKHALERATTVLERLKRP